MGTLDSKGQLSGLVETVRDHLAETPSHAATLEADIADVALRMSMDLPARPKCGETNSSLSTCTKISTTTTPTGAHDFDLAAHIDMGGLLATVRAELSA